MNQAVASARRNHPRLRAARARTQASDARADQAGAALRPRLDASGRYSASTGSPFTTDLTGRTSYGAGLSASVLLYDFGRTRDQQHAAEVSASAQMHSERGAEQDVVLDVRVAFLDAKARKDLVVIAEQRFASESRHLAQVKALVDAGSRPPIDLAKSSTLVATARASLVRARSDYQIALARLRVAMGVTGSGALDVSNEPLAPVANETAATSVLYDEAASNRPDLAAARDSVRAGKLGLASARKSNHPAFRFGTDLSVGGTDLSRPSWTASAGLSISFTLLDGGAKAAKVRAEHANVSALQAQQDVLAQNTWLAVEQARLAVLSAKSEIASAVEAHKSAQQLLGLAEGRYAQGVGNAVELADAQLEVTTAASRVVQTRLQLDVARARLVHVLGRTDWR